MSTIQLEAEEHRFRGEIFQDIIRLQEIFDSRILWGNPHEIYFKSVFIEVIVHLRDLLAKADKIGLRVSFSDDMAVDAHITDVTGLITFFRNAVCHIDSYTRRVTDNEIHTLSFFEGKVKFAGYNESIEVGSDYDDDRAFATGKKTIYLKRHIERAFEELKVIFAKPFSVRYTLR